MTWAYLLSYLQAINALASSTKQHLLLYIWCCSYVYMNLDTILFSSTSFLILGAVACIILFLFWLSLFLGGSICTLSLGIIEEWTATYVCILRVVLFRWFCSPACATSPLKRRILFVFTKQNKTNYDQKQYKQAIHQQYI